MSENKDEWTDDDTLDVKAEAVAQEYKKEKREKTEQDIMDEEDDIIYKEMEWG